MPTPAIAVPPGAVRAGETRDGIWEEGHDAAGHPRPHYAAVLAELAEQDLAALSETVAWRAALARVAARRGALVVNSSQDGGKDTWVLRS